MELKKSLGPRGPDLVHAAPPVVVATMKPSGPTAKHEVALGQLMAASCTADVFPPPCTTPGAWTLQSPPESDVLRIIDQPAVAKHVPAAGQLTSVTSAVLTGLSVLQFAPPSVVVTSRPPLPTAV